jgi:hypothetical protein
MVLDPNQVFKNLNDSKGYLQGGLIWSIITLLAIVIQCATIGFRVLRLAKPPQQN